MTCIVCMTLQLEHLPRYAAASRLAGDVGDGLSVGTGSSLGECRRTCGSKRKDEGPNVATMGKSKHLKFPRDFCLRNLGEMFLSATRIYIIRWMFKVIFGAFPHYIFLLALGWHRQVKLPKAAESIMFNFHHISNHKDPWNTTISWVSFANTALHSCHCFDKDIGISKLVRLKIPRLS